MRTFVCAAVLLLTSQLHAATLRVSFARNGDKGPLTVRLLTRDAAQRLLGKRTIPAAESAATFEDIEPGKYALLVEGDEPLKRLRTIAVATEGATSVTQIELPRGYVFGRFTRGGKPLPNTNVTLRHSDERWVTSLTTKDDGSYASVTWRRGELEVSVSVDGAEPAFAGFLVIPDGPSPTIDFAVPDSRVTGRVVTVEGWPAADAQVTLESAGPPRRVIRRSTDANGAFSYAVVPAGAQTLRVIAADRLLRPAPMKFELGAGASRDVVLRLANGVRRSVEVADSRGVPIASAALLCVAGGEIRAITTTDDKGTATIDTPRDGEVLLYVIPREGSFARVQLQSDAQRVRVRVPTAGAAIDLVAKTVEGAAVPEVAFMMRFNGEVFPDEVVREMQSWQGLRLMTDDDGLARLPNVPPGFYEFWPYRGNDEVVAILESGIDPQIGFNARVGENRVTVRFQKKEQIP
ncbi:MAG TPA: carboxypeptidase-like regulatory domain-containing protein [Thermoanaerobaculia bacterium]|nr:carboxypeptidase-like regulatory domain-containing protein [Thermoanaerobaculia bacterium]